jgi:hypothetical protein
MGTTSPRLGIEEQGGPTMIRLTRLEDTDQEAHSSGGLEDNYRSNLINRVSRDRVRVKYNDN